MSKRQVLFLMVYNIVFTTGIFPDIYRRKLYPRAADVFHYNDICYYHACI